MLIYINTRDIRSATPGPETNPVAQCIRRLQPSVVHVMVWDDRIEIDCNLYYMTKEIRGYIYDYDHGFPTPSKTFELHPMVPP